MQQKRLSRVMKTLLLGLIAFLICIAIARPIDNLSGAGHIVLASVAIAISLWVFRPAGGTYTIGLAVILLGGTMAGFGLPDLTSGFANSSLWLLVSAMFLGYALLKTGLGRRLVFLLLMRIPLSYPSIMLVWFVIGLAFSRLSI